MTETITVEEEQEEGIIRGRYITFAVGEETYGLNIRNVIEITGMQPISILPEAPDYIKGVINLRGKIIPVMDMRLRFRKEPIKYTERTCILVVDIHGTSVGFIVDAVAEVLTINDEEITLPPQYGANENRYLCGIGKADGKIQMLLDCGKLVADEETEALNDKTRNYKNKGGRHVKEL